jgi:NADH-quinone oxidoreductase subunit H
MIGNPFGWIQQQLMTLLTGWGLSEAWAAAVVSLMGAAILAAVLMFSTFFLIWGERKLLARMQDRLGPNRIGPWGVFQTVADFVKLLGKEIVTPAGVDRFIYYLAPLLVVMSVIGIWAVMPLAPGVYGTDLDVGILYVVGIGAIGELGILMAGYSSNNKFAMLGAFRAVAQLVSYEVPMVLILLVPTILAGSMNLETIVRQQSPLWFVIVAPLAALVFLITSIAENGRAPFDLLEAESELVAGFNTEYSALAFGMFYVAEFLHAFTAGAVITTLFLGGWRGPGAEAYPILGFIYFLIKTLVVWFLGVWIRGTVPRIRIDQLLGFNWKLLTPLALGILTMTALADKLALELGWNRLVANLGANLIVALVTIMALRAFARSQRKQQELRRAAVLGTAAASSHHA